MGADVYKVADKMFAVFGDKTGRITLKCASEDQAALLIEAGAAIRAPHLPRGGWVAFLLADLDPEEGATRQHDARAMRQAGHWRQYL